jgi:hypothetical protein
MNAMNALTVDNADSEAGRRILFNATRMLLTTYGGIIIYLKKEKVVIFKAISKGKFNLRTERYDVYDMYELKALHIPIDARKVHYYKEYTKERPITTSGANKHVVILSSTPRYEEQGSDYIVVPKKLTARRFSKVSNEDSSYSSKRRKN